MKKTLLLTMLMAIMLVCVFAISVGATEINGIHYTLDGTNNTATVSDGNKNGTLAVVDIPETVSYKNVTYTVTDIQVNAFRDNKIVTSVSIPSTMSWTYGYTFTGCSNLVSFTYPENCSIRVIPESAFSGTALTTINIPSSITTVGKSAFAGCSNLESIVLPAGVTSLGDNAFQNCSKITSLVIPEGVSIIPHNGLHGCSGLRELTVPKGCTVYGQYSFNQSGSKLTIKYTGTEGDTGYTSFKKYLSQAKYEFVNHCDTYYNGSHIGNFEYKFTSFVEECYTEGFCSRCNETKKNEIFAPMYKFLGYSSNGENMCSGYVINTKSIAKYESENTNVKLKYGFVVSANNDTPIDENGVFGENVISVDLSKKEYSVVDFILTGDFSITEYATAQIVMNLYLFIIDADSIDVNFVYGYGTEDGKIVSEIYKTPNTISFNDLNP